MFVVLPAVGTFFPQRSHKASFSPDSSKCVQNKLLFFPRLVEEVLVEGIELVVLVEGIVVEIGVQFMRRQVQAKTNSHMAPEEV